MQIPTAANPDHTMQRSCLHQSLRAILHWQLQQPFGSFRKGETCSPLCIWLFRLYGRFPCSSLIPALSWRQGGDTLSGQPIRYLKHEFNVWLLSGKRKHFNRWRKNTKTRETKNTWHSLRNWQPPCARDVAQSRTSFQHVPKGGGGRHQHGAGTFVYEIVGLYVSVWLSIDKPL